MTSFPKGRATAPFFCACSLTLLALPARAWTPYFELDAFAHAEPVAVHDYLNDWKGSLDGGSDAVTHNRIEIGVRNDAWSVGYVQKYDYEIKASRDAAILYHQIKNKQDLTPGTVYNLNLRAFHNRSQGLRLARRHSRGELDIEAGLTVLSGQALIDGSIHGVGSAINSNEYAYNASVSYHYNEDVLFDRNVRGPSGEGFSLDLAINYRFSNQWNLALSGSDLLGFLYWRDAPATSAVATSDTQEFDADGYLRFRPTLTGLEFNEDYRQRLHARGRAALQWQALQGTRLDVKLRMTEVESYPSLSISQQLAHSVLLDLEWMPSLDAVGAGLHWHHLRLSVLSDAWRFEDAHVLQLQLGWMHRF